jgi:hypothetical protein
MAYCTTEDVFDMAVSLIGRGATRFDETTNPSERAIERWMTSGCAIIETSLRAHRYNAPPPIDTPVYDMLSELNALYAAARAEMTRAVATLDMGQRTKGQVLLQQFNDGLKSLCEMDLTIAGATRSDQVGRVYTGGINAADKDAQAANMIPSRFARGQFNIPGTIERSDLDSASSAGAIRNSY